MPVFIIYACWDPSIFGTTLKSRLNIHSKIKINIGSPINKKRRCYIVSNGKVNSFGKLGRLITKRKFSIIAAWMLLLAIILPVVLTATGVTSLTLNNSSESDSESARADAIIKAQFQGSVSNDSLVVIISTDDASSLATQRFMDDLNEKLTQSSAIKGLENITTVYSILIPALNATNEGVYEAYEGGNLTYNLLYSVPTIYSNVWYQAYNETKEGQLMPGLNQTAQGIYLTADNANMTYYLLYSVPAAYSGIWAGAYITLNNANLTYNLLYSTPAIYLQAWQRAMAGTSGDVAQSNIIANQTTAETLYAADPEAYQLYTSQLLQVFYSTWAQSFSDSSTSVWTPVERAVFASDQTNQIYINNFLAGNATAQTFVTALTDTLTLQDYLNNAANQTANNVALADFAIEFIASQPPKDTSASSYITAPESYYNLDAYTITALNNAAYAQTQAMLQAADPDAYAQYTSQLLYAFNMSWVMSFQNPQTAYFNSTTRASLAADMTNQQYIQTAFANNQTMQDFMNGLTDTFSLETFLFKSQEQNNEQIADFAIQYVANQSDAAVSFVEAAYHLGRYPYQGSISELADNIIWYSELYGMDKLIPIFNKIAYDTTKDILKDIDQDAYNDYTSHMLEYFDDAWISRVPNSPYPAIGWVNHTASTAADIANAQFIPEYLSDGQDFAEQIASTLKLQDYLDANTSESNRKVQAVTINYVANQSGLSKELVTAVWSMGENATNTELQILASQIVSNPAVYNVSEQFNQLIDSFVSPSKNVTLISITFVESNDDNVPVIRGIIADLMEKTPGDVNSAQVTGTDALNYDFGQSTNEDLDIILPITIVLLVGATGLFFRSIVTPIITLGTIGVGLGVSQIFPYLISTYINPVDYTVSTVLLTVLIGVGTDYSIFIIARHREERINGLPLFEAIKKSITWAGESIVTSGATVIISFFALAGTSMILMQSMGIIVGLGVLVTLLASLTFAPALTAILGDRIFWPNSGERFERYAKTISAKNQRRGGYFARSGAFSVKHGKAIILLAVLITLPAFYVYATTTPTYDMLGAASNDIESIAASNTMTDSFGGGRLMPTYVVVTFTQPILYTNGSFNDAEMTTLQQISQTIANQAGLQEVTGPTMPYGDPVDYMKITNDTDPATYNSMLSAIGEDNSSALITVKFSVDPYSTQAMDYASDIRNQLHQEYDNSDGVSAIYLGGTTGGSLDTRISFENQFNQILPIVAVGVGIVLFFVLGSLILPVFAILSVLMSIVWTLAVTILVFNAAYGFGLLFITPLILFVLLLGLGMDYNIFILTRIREEAAKGQHQNDAIVNAIQQTGGIITAAAIILAGSLGALMLSSNLMLAEMGFAFAFSILIDALIVRTYIVPAVMSTFGKWNWYNPIKRLQRVKDDNKIAAEPSAESSENSEAADKTK